MSERKSFLLRVDAHTLDLIKAWADDDFRSLNGQLEYILREALKRAGRLPSAAAKPSKSEES